MSEAKPATDSGSQVIGFIGLGAMGGPIVRHLLSQGHSVVVHDLNPEAVRAAEQAGARAAPDVPSLARQARLIFICLPSLDALRSVLLGPAGIAGDGSGSVVVDLSTTGPAFAREMRAALEPQEVNYLDAPITGNVTTAGNGKLGVMCSGPGRGFTLAEPVLRVMAGSTVLYLGEASGRAQTLKLLNNLNSAAGMAVSCEAFILGAKSGLRPRTMLQVINAGEASTNASRNKFASSVLPRRFNYGARMAITAKDISFTVAEAERLGVPIWIARPVQQLWRYAVSQGGGDRDGSALITYLEPWACVEVGDSDESHSALVQAPEESAMPACQILCEPEYSAVLMNRLTKAGWDVSMGRLNEPIAPARCTIRIVPDGTNPAELNTVLGRVCAKGTLIVNTCWQPASDAADLAQGLNRQGLQFIDAPTTGRARDIEENSGPVIVSGDGQSVMSALPVLRLLGAAIYQVSAQPGDAQKMRQIEQAVAAVLLATACEAYVIGARAGLAPETMLQILGIETGRTLASATLFPQQISTRRFDHGKRLGTAMRALTLVCNDAARLHISPWVLESARLLYGIAVSRLGEDADVTQLVQLYEQWAGVEIHVESPAGAA